MSPERNLIAWNNWDSKKRLAFLHSKFPALKGKAGVKEWSTLKWYALPVGVIDTIKEIRGRVAGSRG